MARTRASIPILGVDERPNERQKVPGIATEVENLRPTGLKDEPEWVPIEDPDYFKEVGGGAYDPGNNVSAMYWHIRGRIGKHGGDLGSLKRLVVLTDNGLVKVVDPGDSLWYVTDSFQVVSDDGGEWDMHISQMYDTGYITITKGGVPQKDLILEDDLLLEFSFPALPVIRSYPVPSKESYSETEKENHEYNGIGNGVMYVRYALRLNNGTLVRHSLPEQIVFGHTPAGFVWKLAHHFEGYGDNTPEPDNFEFWKDKISGVTVLCSEYRENVDSVFNSKDSEQNNFLEKTAWYEIDTFDFIDGSEQENDKRNITSGVSDTNFATFPTADVDDNTHHSKAHGPSISYNSRIMLGRERIDFGKGVLNNKEGISNLFFHFIDGGWYDGPLAGNGDLTTQEKFPMAIRFFTDSNIMNGVPSKNYETNIDLINIGNGMYAVTNAGQNWSVKFTFEGYGSVIITQDMFKENADGAVVHNASGIVSGKIKLEVELETDNGNFTRVHDGNEFIRFYPGIHNSRDASAEGSWQPQGNVIGYPDGRAKRMTVYWYHSDVDEYREAASFKLRSAQKANYSVVYAPFIDMFKGTAMAVDSGLNDEKEYTPNKVVGSDVNSALSFESDLVYVIGRSNNPVTGFSVNALALSEGQFGQYPLYVFKSEAIYALEQSQSASVVFGRITPVDISMGVESEEYIVNAGRSVVFANSSGIYVMSGPDVNKISDPVKSVVKDVKAMGYLKSNDNEELLVSSGDKIYLYSITYGRWYSFSHEAGRVHHFFFTDNEKLYSLSSIGNDYAVYDFQDNTGSPLPWKIVLKNIHFGSADTRKRFHYFYLRAKTVGEIVFNAVFGTKVFGGNSDTIRPKWRSSYECDLIISGTGNKENTAIHKIDTEFTPRYQRKLRS